MVLQNWAQTTKQGSEAKFRSRKTKGDAEMIAHSWELTVLFHKTIDNCSMLNYIEFIKNITNKFINNTSHALMHKETNNSPKGEVLNFSITRVIHNLSKKKNDDYKRENLFKFSWGYYIKIFWSSVQYKIPHTTSNKIDIISCTCNLVRKLIPTNGIRYENKVLTNGCINQTTIIWEALD